MQVVINCSLSKQLNYYQTTPTTHHMLMGHKQQYLLEFDNKDDAGIFATAISTISNTGESIAVVTAKVSVHDGSLTSLGKSMV